MEIWRSLLAFYHIKSKVSSNFLFYVFDVVLAQILLTQFVKFIDG